MVTPRSAPQYPEYQVQGSGSYTYPAGNHVTYRVKVLIERVTPGNVADITQVIQNGTTNPAGGTVNVPLDWTMVATPPVGGDLYRVTVVGTIYGANQVGISTTLYQTVNVSLVP